MENFKPKIFVIACWMIVLVLEFDTIISHSFVNGKQKIPKKYLGPKRQGTVKTIMIPEDGDLIDCVDFYQQPAFDDPLIKALPVDPDLYPPKASGHGLDEILKNWHKYGGCPNGTIAIRRTNNHNTFRKTRLPFNSINQGKSHEYAIVKQNVGVYHGGGADISVWNPKVVGREFSLSQMWIEAGVETLNEVNTMEAGWIVYPNNYRDRQTRFFIYWTRDNYNKTGCYDLECPGFIQTYTGPIIGYPLAPVSKYKGAGYHITVTIYKNKKSGNWVLKKNGEVLGYWPHQTFSSLSHSAETIAWGGEIVNHKSGLHHTSTEMGSGHFSSEGFTRSSYFSRLSVMNDKGTWFQPNPDFLLTFASNPECYDLSVPRPHAYFGTHFFYGGPGYSIKCK